MNENPEGTPNPLNPIQGTAPVGPIEEPAVEQPKPEQTAPEPIPEQPAPEQPAPEQPAPEPEQPMPAPEPEQPATVEVVSEEVSVSEKLPESMTIEKPKKPKKTGLVVAIILLVIAVITGMVAAIILLNPFAKADAVPAAISKLLSGEMPKYVSMDGTVNVKSGSSDSMFSSLELDFDGGVNNGNGESYANAKVMATLADGSKFNFNANEIHTGNGDLYLKLSNLYTQLNSYYSHSAQEETRVLVDGETEIVIAPEPVQENESLIDYLGVFDVIDNEWIYIPKNTFSNVSDLTSIDTPTQCLIDAAGKLGQFGSDFAAKYQQYPFINYSTDNLGIIRKANELYRLTFDSDKLAGFINSLNNSGFMNELLACVGGVATNTDIDASQLAQIIASLPIIYVEIDDNNNFTRLYLSVATPDGLTTVTADIALSYPTGLTIEEPLTYIDYNQVLSKILSQFYGQPIVSGETIITD